MAVTWQQLKHNIVNGNISIVLARNNAVQKQYEEVREYVKSLNFRYYSDFLKIKHLNYNSRINKKGLITAYKTKHSLSSVFVENIYPYDFYKNDNIKHYLIWSIDPLQYEQINNIVKSNAIDFSEWLWFVNSSATQSVKDLWHCHILLKK